jgi:DNA-binding transcriptional MerR regulator
MRIGELAAASGVRPSRIRFYERAGLLTAATRRPNGYRVNDATALEELAFIATAQDLGFTLAEIRPCMPGVGGKIDCDEARRLLRGRLAALDGEIARAQGMRARIVGFIARLDDGDHAMPRRVPRAVVR